MKKVNRIMIVILVLLIGVGLGLLIWLLCSNDTVVRKVELRSDGETREELSFSAENILPGNTREYTIIVHSGEGGEYDVTFACKDVTGGELWKYLDFGLEYNGTKKELAFGDLVAGTKLSFEVEMKKGGTAEFTVTYTMPREVGNEAQYETTDFTLLLTAQRK